MFGVIMPLCNRMFCCIFGWYFYIEIRLKQEKIFCCPALEHFHCLPPLFCCLPLWKTVRLHGKKLQNATKVSGGRKCVSLTSYMCLTAYCVFDIINSLKLFVQPLLFGKESDINNRLWIKLSGRNCEMFCKHVTYSEVALDYIFLVVFFC